jgi:thiol-disulfide isomerase/thioredoxin
MKTKTPFTVNFILMKFYFALSFMLLISFQQSDAQIARKILAEDFTGMWCGYCPLGRTVAEHLEATYPNEVINVGMHDFDNLQSDYSHAIDSVNTYGYPGFMLDRTFYYGNNMLLGVGASCVGSDLDGTVDTRLAVTSPVEVDISSSYNSGTRALQVNVTANFAAAATGVMNINCVLTEDSISTPGEQHNYMNTDANYPCWEGQGDPTITTYFQRHTARINFSSTEWGDGGVIPASVTASSSYHKLYNYTVPSAWDATHMFIVAFVSHYGRFASGLIDSTKIDILNANTARLGQFAGINEISNSPVSEMNVFPNPSSDNTYISYYLKQEGNISVKIMDIIGKEIVCLKNDNEFSGDHLLMWNGKDEFGNAVSNGMYFCVINAGGNSIVKKIQIIH